ncbi:hypothetical protein FXF51_06185 [Nonomuraea sp. PA05]|uniref:hypothetical protein n=1 Tax=Nonomuraea sp. PA05 TaxID=2604466 RepID=UPI0011D35512|nr:hypothetical protein [Nonomuraea sp. PA05]TYB69749.1 hypothetical protein FXF51_06185 [Nonomuraea sp. PA05]
MARYTAAVEGVASGTAAKTLLQIVAGTQRCGVYGIRVSCKGTSSIAEPVRFRLVRQTTAGTSGGTASIGSVDSSGVSATATANITFSSTEPTSGDLLFSQEVHPQTGMAEYIPLGDEIVIPASGRLGLTVTAAATVNCTVQLYWREGH